MNTDARQDTEDYEDYEDEMTFAAVAYIADPDGAGDMWTVRSYNDRELGRIFDGLDNWVAMMRGLRAPGAVLGLLCVDDDWCAVVRPTPNGVRCLMSDATAALSDDLADEILAAMGVDAPSEEDAADFAEGDEAWPEGDFGIVDDLGSFEQILSVIFDDETLFASEQIVRVAEELGFAEELVEELAENAGVELELGDGSGDGAEFGGASAGVASGGAGGAGAAGGGPVSGGGALSAQFSDELPPEW